MEIDTSIATTLWTVGLTVAVAGVLGALSGWARPDALSKLLGVLATAVVACGIGALILLSVVYFGAESRFDYETPNDLITTMKRADVDQVVIERGEKLTTGSSRPIRLAKSLHVPVIDVTVHSTSTGPTIPDTSDEGTDFYELFNPGKNHCDYREYKGRAVEICRDYGNAVRMRLVERRGGQEEPADETDLEY
jgi:hypothetical protein